KVPRRLLLAGAQCSLFERGEKGGGVELLDPPLRGGGVDEAFDADVILGEGDLAQRLALLVLILDGAVVEDELVSVLVLEDARGLGEIGPPRGAAGIVEEEAGQRAVGIAAARGGDEARCD